MGLRTSPLTPRAVKGGQSATLQKAELHFPFFGDHVLVPRWVPNDVYDRLCNPRHSFKTVLGILRDYGAHPASRRSQRHIHLYLVSPVFLLHVERVNQSEVHNVYGDFRVVNCFKGIPKGILLWWA